MNEIKTAKSLNKAFLALQSFKRAKALLPIVKMQTDENAKSTLYGALCVFYARPFTQGEKIGRIEPDEVPINLKDTHDELMTFRHKVAAHSDGVHEILDEAVNCVKFVNDESGFRMEEFYPCPTDHLLENIGKLIDEMLSAVCTVITDCMENGVPASFNFEQGTYKINIENNSSWFTKE